MTYNTFLKNKCDEYRKTNNIGYRGLSKLCGFNSPNYLLLVGKGERQLSAGVVQGIAIALNMSISEKETFYQLYLNYKQNTSEQSSLNALQTYLGDK